MKKITTAFITFLMIFSLAACGTNSSDNGGISEAASESGQTVAETKQYSDAEDELYVITNDGDSTKITGEAFNEYFDGDAAEGVEDLLNAGRVYVNGIKVPQSEDEIIEYQVNGVASLYKTDSGWGYNVHKTTSADNLSFEDARLGFIETITTVRGHFTTLYGDKESGQVTKLDAQSFDVVRVTDITVYNESTTVSRGDFELETNRIRPDVDEIIFHSEKFDQTLGVGDFALYYYGEDGWNIFKADSLSGKLSKDSDGNFVLESAEESYVSVESNVSRYNLINCNRPTQFYNAYVALGLEDLEIVMWLTPTGHPIGFTYGDKAKAKEALSIAIANANAAADAVTISEDGSDLENGTRWVAQADMDEFLAAIEAAQSVYNNNSTAVQEFDMAIYNLAVALGESGENPSGFLGATGFSD